MNWLGELRRRLEYLFRRKRLDADLAEEMRTHLDLRAAEQAEPGVSADEARAQARRRFGNVTQLREASREAWGWAWLDSLAQDLRYGLRTLASHPGFTLTAVLSLALGIGANTAIFTILNAVMLRSLPVEDPQRLVELRAGRNSGFTNPIWEEIRAQQQIFSGVLAYSDRRFDLAEGGESRFAQGVWVSGDYFHVLGVPALRGRVFTPEDDRHGGGKSGPVAVISYAFWQGYFGGDPGVIGRTIKLDRHPFEIVGVTPPWFTGLNVDRGFEVAIPIGCEPILHADRSALEDRGWWWLRILGRLPSETSIQQAGAGLMMLAPEINRATLPTDWNASHQKEYLGRTLELRPAATGFSSAGLRYRDSLFTLMAVVGLVLLIACANIANLLLARSAARHREISIRLAIGAGRGRVIRQLLTESLLLSLFGAAGGLLLARWGSTLLVKLLSTTRDPLELDLAPDGHVLAFTIGVAVITGALFGLAPAFRATCVSPNHVLKEHARGSVTGASRFRLGQALVAGQIGLSLVLLVGAGLFLGTLRNLLNVPAGFDRRNLLLVHAGALEKVQTAQRADLCRSILERLRGLPGVTSASASMITPISGGFWNDVVFPEGFQSKSTEDALTFFNRVSPGFFRTMGTALLAGRDFEERDTLNSPKVMILNETAARSYFGRINPIGKTVAMEANGKPGVRDTYEVVGVVADSKYADLDEGDLRTRFMPVAQNPKPRGEIYFEVRSFGAVEGLTPAIRSAFAEADRGISLEFMNFDTQVNESLIQQRTVALLSSFFGGLALLLAMIGLYGVTSYAVLRRQSEIGIRIALGASQRTVIWLVLRNVVTTLAIGTLVGIAAALAAGRLVASLLFGVKPADPATIAAAALVLAASTALAGYLPARRASLLDPTSALREE